MTAETIDVGTFTFDSGETIPSLEIAYESHGEFTGDNAVLVCHALTGSAHVARLTEGESEESPGQARAWWDDTVGPGKAIDTTEFFVVCANVPGSCYGTTGPASTNPETGEPYGSDFPPVTVGDWTRAQRRLLDELGVSRLHAVVGGSIGGMNALDWVRRYPDDVDRVASVAAAPRLDAQGLALTAVARRAIRADPAWNGGDYYDDDRPDPDDGLAIARQLGHVTYLSKTSMTEKFGRRPAGQDRFPSDLADDFFPYRKVESYLDYNAATFVDRFDANSYLYLTRAMDDFDLSAGYESDADALSGFEGEALVMSVVGDWHFTVEQSAALADAFREAGISLTHHVIDSSYGHDAFLVEPDHVNPPLADFLGRDGSGPEATADAEPAPVHSSLIRG